MDYILKQIEENIQLYDGDEGVKVFYQIRTEYKLILILAYIWNRNFKNIDFVVHGQVSREIQKPTIGTIIGLIRKLDEENIVFTSQSENLFNDYLDIRNNLIGHGYVLNDGLSDYVQQFCNFYDSLLRLNIPIINNNVNLIFVEKYDSETNNYIGKNFHYEGSIRAWSCSKEVCDFQLKNLYASYEINSYHRLSPFIHIEKPKKLYLFNSIQELLLGKVKYNRIDETDTEFNKNWEELCNSLSINDGVKEKTPNKTIINNFENNYQKYIDVGIIKNKILTFLIGDRKSSSVSTTIWGHGGVGKTATVQSICDYLKTDTKLKKQEKFDYIIFLTAKDRRLNLFTAKIEEMDNRISSFEGMIKKINIVLFNEGRFI